MTVEPTATPAPTRIVRIARAQRFTVVGGTVLIVTSGVWALLPLRSAAPPAIELDRIESRAPTDVDRSPLNLAAFEAPIWIAPPARESAQETTPAPAPPPPALITLELVAIERTAEAPRAALYDPKERKLHMAQAGAIVAGHEIGVIGDNEVTLTIQGRAGVLVLRETQAPIELDSLRRVEQRGGRTP
jgi:hypothetical protein